MTDRINDNCLMDCKCPKCGQVDRFTINAECMVTMTDEGVEGYGDVEYGESAYASCRECEWTGTVGDLREPLEPTSPAAK